MVDANTSDVEPSEPKKFEDVLSDYQDLNDRLERVAAALRIANAELCPKVWRDPGFTVHKLQDYPPSIRFMAEELLGLEDGKLYIRAVRRGSSAQAQFLEAGDEILSVNNQPLSSDLSMERYNRAVLKNGFAIVKPRIEVRTAKGREFTARIEPDTACDAPVKVVFSDAINGHTDGEAIFITSALMRHVIDDTNLALIIAHEMSHIIAGHIEFAPSQDLELVADQMALVLMARAGFDVETAVEYWKDSNHPHEGGEKTKSSHPATSARYKNFKKELKRIRKTKDLNKLGFR